VLAGLAGAGGAAGNGWHTGWQGVLRGGRVGRGCQELAMAGSSWQKLTGVNRGLQGQQERAGAGRCWRVLASAGKCWQALAGSWQKSWQGLAQGVAVGGRGWQELPGAGNGWQVLAGAGRGRCWRELVVRAGASRGVRLLAGASRCGQCWGKLAQAGRAGSGRQAGIEGCWQARGERWLAQKRAGWHTPVRVGTGVRVGAEGW